MSQEKYDRLSWETTRALLMVFVWMATFAILFSTLTACSELKYAECIARDNTRNPCN